jgi:putative colanic acid biosynthesis acetyltransferase WcaF
MRDTARLNASKPLNGLTSNSLAGGPSFSFGHRLHRAIWIVVWILLASWTPAKMRGWRAFLLRLFGAQIDKWADVRGSARVWYPPNLHMQRRTLLAEKVNCYNMAPIILHEGAMVSQGAHLCGGSHDIDDPAFQLVARPISIGENAWIAAEAFVGPGVTIGNYAVIGARAVVMRDVRSRAIAVGNPARELTRQRKITGTPIQI